MDGWPLWQRLYRKQVSRDLDVWTTRGWVTPQNAEAIRKSLESHDGASRLPLILSLLGAALLGLGALSFVAANWEEMPRLLRLALLFGALGAAYAAAIWLYAKQHRAFAEAALLLAALLFGANIMLIAQMYHLPSNYTGGLLAWSAGTLALAWAAKSRAVLGASFVLLFIWTATATFDAEISPHWTYAPFWIAATLLGLRLQWTPAYHLTLLSFAGWMLLAADGLFDYGWEASNIASFFLAISLLTWIKGRVLAEEGQRVGRVTECYGVIAVSFLLFILQFDTMNFDWNTSSAITLAVLLGASIALLVYGLPLRAFPPAGLIGIGVLMLIAALPYPLALAGIGEVQLAAGVGGVLFFAYAIWLIFLGTGLASRFLVNLGFTAFAVEAVYLYIETVGTLLDTALFFALGGVLLIAGSFALNRWRRRVLERTKGADA